MHSCCVSCNLHLKQQKSKQREKKADSPLPAGCGTANPGSRKGTPVVTPAGFNSLTPYVVKEVIKLTKSFKASLDSASFACSNLKKIQKDHVSSTNLFELKSL